MSGLVARTGRHQQRYEAGCRLIAGCIPFKHRNPDEGSNENSEKVVEVLMINSPSGPGLLFPKGGWENDETVEEAAIREAIEEAGVRGVLMFSPEGSCKAAMFALFQNTRRRSWLTIPEAYENCRHPWMREALKDGFSSGMKTR
ncbi:hypothetical protein AAG906_019753 [Vitis piasezkii]